MVRTRRRRKRRTGRWTWKRKINLIFWITLGSWVEGITIDDDVRR